MTSSSSSSTAALAGIKRPRTGSGNAAAAAGSDTAGTAASAQSPSAAKNSHAPATTSVDMSSTSTRNQDTSTGASGVGSGNGNGNDDGEAESSPEGLLMAHALRALTSHQRGQFGAYRAAAFPADAVAAYVSHRLCHNEERRYVRRHGTAGVLGGGGTGEEDGAVGGGGGGIGVVPHSGWGRQALRRCPYVDHVEEAAAATAASSPTTVAAPPLRDMVAPETEQEITAVVSALAKLHAQRLVAAARRLATAQGHPLSEPLRPHHIVQAKRYRTEAGLDPGFFMGIGGGGGNDRAAATSAVGAACGGGGAAAAAALDMVDAHRLKMEASLEAQREYDAHFGGDNGEDAGEGEKTTMSKRRKTGEKDEDGDTKMEE